ncbi:hypothetical protein [Paenibacillus tarimensis]|uniref:hypothetical protein n=1 Tax=Paenibacillus tarimensis TaxID=416012 RepID=UPI001F3B1355|nr:hypothetical protein [Paenibacillus tarimensis]MCF2945166.1 hypothetical protein [Paenibacillus tarimensis]
MNNNYSNPVEERLGPNCYWNNWLPSLQFYGISHYALAFINFSCVYTGHELSEFIEDETDETIRWIFEAIKPVEDPFSYHTIEHARMPVLLTLDLYYLGKKYSAYLKEHELHILNVCGMRDGHFSIIDNHYGISSLVDQSIIEAAITSDKIDGCGRLITLNLNSRTDRTAETIQSRRGAILKKKIEYYLSGIYLPGINYPGGRQAVTHLKKELPTLLSLYSSESCRHKWLSIRINQYFRYPREGLLHFLQRHFPLYSQWIPSEFMILLAVSADKLRDLVMKILIAQLRPQSLDNEVISINRLLQEIEDIEMHIAKSLQLIYNSLP